MTASKNARRKARRAHQRIEACAEVPQYSGYRPVYGVLDEIGSGMHKMVEDFNLAMRTQINETLKTFITPNPQMGPRLTIPGLTLPNGYRPGLSGTPQINTDPIVIGTSWAASDANPLQDMQDMMEKWGLPKVPQLTGNPFKDAKHHWHRAIAKYSGSDGMWQTEVSYNENGYIGCGSCEDVWCEHLSYLINDINWDGAYLKEIVTDRGHLSHLKVPIFPAGSVEPVGFAEVEIKSRTDNPDVTPFADVILWGPETMSMTVARRDQFNLGVILLGDEGLRSLTLMVADFIKGDLSFGTVTCGSGSHWRKPGIKKKSDTLILSSEDAVYYLLEGKCKWCFEYSKHVNSGEAMAPQYEKKWKR